MRRCEDGMCDTRLRYFESRIAAHAKIPFSEGMVQFYRLLLEMQSRECHRLRNEKLPELTAAQIPLSIKGEEILRSSAVREIVVPGVPSLISLIHSERSDIGPAVGDAIIAEETLLGRMTTALLCSDTEGIARAASEIGIGTDDCAFIAANLSRPLLTVWREKTPIPDGGEPDSHCPFCGHQAGMSILVAGAEGGRYLCCTLCGNRWRYKRIACAVCGNEDASRLIALSLEEDPRLRLDCCETCGSYLKTVSLDRAPAEDWPDAFVEDILSAHLDTSALTAGYRRA